MRKPLHIWITFLACFALLLAAMAWVSWHTLALERTREEAARDADQQERVRLALWRLDFQASALLMRENARPPHDFRPFHAPEGLVNKAYANVTKGDVLVPSPLLAEVPEHVLLHFQMDTAGRVMSPQVPQNDERALALSQFINADDLTRSEKRLSGLRELLAQPSNPVTPRREVSSSFDFFRGAASSAPAAQPLILNRRVLAEAACVAGFEFSDAQPLEINNDASLPRNAAWAVQQGQVAQQQSLYSIAENSFRSRAVNAQAEEAVKQQPMIKMKEPPAKALAKTDLADAQSALAVKEMEAKKQVVADKLEKPVRPSATVASSAAASPAPAARAMPSPAAVPLSDAAQADVVAEGTATSGANVVTRKNAPAPNSSRPFQGVWLGKDLILTREAFVDGVRMVQGVWLDWPELHAAWLREITDLFPDAKLEPAANTNAGARPTDDPLRFAALPVRLVPGVIELPPLPFWTPLRRSLAIALACVLLAAAAVGLVLHGTVALSERRADFVSAVTHELRTPLTTFRLYSEMLADGMVTDEAQRKTYLDTLTGEAGRLSHLVENVLAYARLGEGACRKRDHRRTAGPHLAAFEATRRRLRHGGARACDRDGSQNPDAHRRGGGGADPFQSRR